MSSPTHCPIWAEKSAKGWRMRIWVQPGARTTELGETHDGHLKIRVQAPAVDNKANASVVRFVAQILGLRANLVEIESGHGSRRKSLLVRTEEEPDWSSFSGRAYR